MSFIGIKNNDIASTSSQAAQQLVSAVEPHKQSEDKRTVTFRMIANEADIPAVVDLARAFHEESRFGYIPFSEGKVRKICLSGLRDTKRHGVTPNLINE